MILQFSVKNFKTFKEKATLSLIASNYDKKTREADNIFNLDKFNLRILKSAVIYGANASGKSKFIEAFSFVRRFVIESSKESQKGDTINVEPFRLNSQTENMPSEFEIIFVYKNILYRYGFEVTTERVISEWLYYKTKTKEIELFYRDRDNFDTHERNFTKGKAIINHGLVRDNALLVSVAAQFNDNTAINVIDWFKGLKTISGLKGYDYQGYTMGQIEDPLHKSKILSLLKIADLGIHDITLKRLDIDNIPEEIPKEIKAKIIEKIKNKNTKIVSDVITTHKKYDSGNTYNGDVNFSLTKEESSGTRQFFALIGPIINVLENGYTLIIDEIDSKLHPNLVCRIISLFNSKEINKNNAQLIFNTHDTNLLSANLFRRDQIWFTRKDRYGAAELYSLSDFKSDKVKKNESFEDNYIKGKYGAVPYLNSFDTVNETISRYENEKQKN